MRCLDYLRNIVKIVDYITLAGCVHSITELENRVCVPLDIYEDIYEDLESEISG